MTIEQAAEIVATWMEPRPACTIAEWRDKHPEDAWGDRPYPLWWMAPAGNDTVWAVNLLRVKCLDALHLVEDRLSDKQWDKYRECLWDGFIALGRDDMVPMRCFIHASAETKLLALAAVLEREVKG